MQMNTGVNEIQQLKPNNTWYMHLDIYVYMLCTKSLAIVLYG